MELLNDWAAILGVLFVAVWAAFKWLSMSRDEQRRFITELVERAQMTMTDESGPERMEFVLKEAKKRFPWLPADFLRTLAEAAVKRMKEREPQLFDLGGGAELEVRSIEPQDTPYSLHG